MTFTEEMPILNINISGDYTTEKLKEYSEILQEEIESLTEIKKVDIRGALDKEVEIAVDIYKMMASKVSFYDVISSIQSADLFPLKGWNSLNLSKPSPDSKNERA